MTTDTFSRSQPPCAAGEVKVTIGIAKGAS
jgi:hypothetical protein